MWWVEPNNGSCCGNMSACFMPEYLDGNSRLPISPSSVPPSLRQAQWPSQGPSGPYDVLSDTEGPPGGCRDSPGPASPLLYCVQTQSPTWVAYRWYKFSDQPGIQQALHSPRQKKFLQHRIETLHRILAHPGGGGWIKRRGAEAEGMAVVDGAAVVVPPKGMEVGYVPIALYEGLEKPTACQVEPPPSPPHPRPPPPPPHHCNKPPVPKTCEGKCLQAGHCCQGTGSSYGQPSCAMGCIVANFTQGVADCQRVCRANSGKCQWSIEGVRMYQCGGCPRGCDSSDGPFECEAGCVFAFQK